jgi:hypothetical protein
MRRAKPPLPLYAGATHARGACMSVFEFTFGLSAVILGLALAHMASMVLKLAMAGRRAPPVRFVE